MRCLISHQEFDDSGDPEKHFEDLLSLAKTGVEKGKVRSIVLAEMLFKFVMVFIQSLHFGAISTLFKQLNYC